MLPIDQVSLICPRNDLESDCILGIAARLQVDIREVSGDWGVTLDAALRQHPDLDSLRRHVIVVELPGAAGRDLLTLAGKQVHLVDHHGPASDGPMASALEQFAALVGYELTTAEYEVAIADRDFYPGLTRAGVPLGRAQALRRQEHEIRGTADLLEEARTFVAANARQLGHLTLYFAPERLAKVLLDAAQEPTAQDYTAAANQRRPVPLPQVLAVFHAARDPACIRAVRFAGAAAARAALSTLLTDAELSNSLSLWLGGGDLGCFFGAEARKDHPAPAFDRLMSRVFSLIGGTSRPVLHYGCTFLLPLDLHESSELKTKPTKRAERFFKTLVHKEQAGDIRRHRLAVVSPGSLSKDGDHERRCETQAHLYFLPLLRDLLFDAQCERRPTSPGDPDTPSIQRWRLAPDALDGLSWRLDGPRGDTPGPTAKVCDVSLYRYYNDLYLLAIRVEAMDNPQRIDGAEALVCDHDRWWRPLFDTPADVFARIERLRLDHWLRFTKHARILYPSFIEQIEEAKFDAQTLLRHEEVIEQFPFGADVSPIVLYLLGQFLANDPQQHAEVQRLAHLLRLQNLSEERMFVNVAYGLAGPAPGAPVDRQEADRLFSLALYVDRESDSFQSVGGYAYDPDYTRELARTQRLDRWRALGTYLGFCPYANAYLGFGGFFANVIAAEHVPYHYERMLILALFHQLTLRNYNRRITHATRLLIQPKGRDPGSDFRELRRDFIEFTNCHWFREVTLAIQGKEVFARQVAVLDIAPEYAEVKDEMERADEYVQSVRQHRMDERVFAAAWIAALLAGLALVLPSIEYNELWQWLAWLVLIVPTALSVWRIWRRPPSGEHRNRK